jgi:hypothetical protein
VRHRASAYLVGTVSHRSFSYHTPFKKEAEPHVRLRLDCFQQFVSGALLFGFAPLRVKERRLGGMRGIRDAEMVIGKLGDTATVRAIVWQTEKIHPQKFFPRFRCVAEGRALLGGGARALPYERTHLLPLPEKYPKAVKK